MQKTEYEMRMSDWSSDVCSSDLEEDLAFRLVAAQAELLDLLGRCGVALGVRALEPAHEALGEDAVDGGGEQVVLDPHVEHAGDAAGGVVGVQGAEHQVAGKRGLDRDRSEEHTSELQSLMRSSYAVFCLKKKNSKYGSMSSEHNKRG